MNTENHIFDVQKVLKSSDSSISSINNNSQQGANRSDLIYNASEVAGGTLGTRSPLPIVPGSTGSDLKGTPETSAPLISGNIPVKADSRQIHLSNDAQAEKENSASLICSSIGPVVVAGAKIGDDNNINDNQVYGPNIIIPASRVKDFSALNRTDLDEILAHSELLDQGQLEYVHRIQRKVQLYPKRFIYDQYVPHSTLLALSDWRCMGRYSLCCVRNYINPQGRCRYRQFCRYCSFIRRQQLLRTYLPAYDLGLWHMAHLSFEEGIGFEGGQAYECNEYWTACNNAIRTLVAQGYARGAVWVEEIAVISFLPLLLVRPHVHAVLEADFLGEEAEEFLVQQLQFHRTANGEPLGLSPTVKIEAIESIQALYRSLSYLIKTIELVRQYRNAWTMVEGPDHKQAVQLNSHVTEFLAGYFQISNSERQFQQKVHYVGNLHGSHEIYLGIRPAQRDGFREFVDSVAQQEGDWNHEPDADETP